MTGKFRWTLFSLLAPALMACSLNMCATDVGMPLPPPTIEASLIDCATAETADPLVVFETLTATPICAKWRGYGLPKDSAINVVMRDSNGAQVESASLSAGGNSGILRFGAAPRGQNRLTFETGGQLIEEVRVVTVAEGAYNFGSKPSHFEAHKYRLLALQYRPDSRAFVSGACSDIGRGRATYEPYYCREAEFKIWDVETLSQIGSTLLISSNVHSLAFSPDGTSLAEGGGEGQIALWQLGSNGPPRFLKTAHQDVWRLVWDPTGERIAAASREPTGAEYAIEIYSVSSGVSVRVPMANANGAMVFGRSGKLLALGAKNGDVALLDGATFKIRAKIAGDSSDTARVIAFSPDGRYIAAEVYRGIALYDLSDLDEIRRVATAYENSSVLQFSADGTRLFTGGSSILSLRVPEMTVPGKRTPTFTNEANPNKSGYVSWITPAPDGRTSFAAMTTDLDKPTVIVVWR
ncbi:MAG: WD40 repeat domain-containing protein [Anaerolineae bacterium]|nr:WD40 repeat domain-containing protein [Anaerolineae bacterium]